MYQDEYILGFQKMLTDRLSIGTRAVYRNLKQAIDDNCDYAPILDALAEQGYDPDNAVLPNPGFPYCRMFNPGADAIYVTDPDGSGKLYETLIKGELLSPKAKRTYQSLEVFADGHGDRYSWHASYTWSRSAGNTEGGVKSDIGQADTSTTNLKPMYQDEYILGFQKMLTDRLSIGTRAVYRNLKQAIDDNCDYAPILDALAEQGYDPDNAVLPNPGFPYCRMFNPGADAIYVTDPDGSGKLYETLIKGELLSPKAKRTYQSLEVFADGHGDRYSWHASYTWSRSAGNTEGGVKSDIGQADTSTTQDFDYKELTVDTYGFLPNDRRHALKVFGNYDITPDWSVGANFLAQSGRPINCFGTLPWHGALHPYGASFMRCGGVAVPRGTAGRLPFTNSLDLNLVWTPSFMPGLTLKVDAFNVFNNLKATAIGETGEDGAVGPQYDASGKWIPIDTYRMPRAWQSPRSYRLMIQYTF